LLKAVLPDHTQSQIIGGSLVRRSWALGFALLIGLQLSACATIYTDASDANKVTFLNSTNESRADLQSKAQAYCIQYGKKAFYRETDSGVVTVFDCRP
jgi:putative hemolysin